MNYYWIALFIYFYIKFTKTKRKVMQQSSYTLNLIKMQFLRFCISTISLYILRMSYQFSFFWTTREDVFIAFSLKILIHNVIRSFWKLYHGWSKDKTCFHFKLPLLWCDVVLRQIAIASLFVGVSHGRHDILLKNSWIDYLFMHVPYYVPSTLFFKALELSFHASLHDALVLETSFTFFWEPPTKADAAIFSSFLFSRVVEKFQVNLFYSLRLFYYPWG